MLQNLQICCPSTALLAAVSLRENMDKNIQVLGIVDNKVVHSEDDDEIRIEEL